jgi:tetratricopeptide (TPR) repeat protein
VKRIAILLAFVLAAFPAWAQTRAENVDHCMDDNPDLSIGGCTALIQSGQETNEGLAVAFYNRGVSYFDKNMLDQAIADYTQAIRLRPDDSSAYYNRGIAYRHQGNVDQAISDYTEAIAIKPDDAHAYYNRAALYDSRGQRDLAISDYRQSLRYDPGDPDSINALKNLGVNP